MGLQRIAMARKSSPDLNLLVFLFGLLLPLYLGKFVVI